MITSEDLVKNIFKEIGITRTEDFTANVLTKREMKEVLVYIVALKNRNKSLEEKTRGTKAIVKEVIEQYGKKVIHE